MAGDADINTLRHTETASRTVNLGTGNTLRLGKVGGLWRAVTATGGTLTVEGGALTAGGAADTPGEIVFHTGGTVASSSSTLTVGDGDGGGTFLGTLENNNGTLAVRKVGAGKQVLSGNCTHTGGTTVEAGTLEVSGSLTGGNVAVADGATLDLTGGIMRSGGTVTVDEGGTFNINGGTLRYTNATAFSGDATSPAAFFRARTGRAVSAG